MAKRKLKRLVRNEPVTSEQYERDREIRRKVYEEFPPAPDASVEGSLCVALKAAIEESDKSVYQIAKEAGISPIMISRFLSGERDLRLATADKLARVLGLTVARR